MSHESLQQQQGQKDQQSSPNIYDNQLKVFSIQLLSQLGLVTYNFTMKKRRQNHNHDALILLWKVYRYEIMVAGVEQMVELIRVDKSRFGMIKVELALYGVKSNKKGHYKTLLL